MTPTDRASLDSLKDWMRQSFAWHVKEGQNLLRMGAAKGMAIDPEAVNRPFPGSPGNTTVMTTLAGGDPTAPAAAAAAPPAAASPPAAPVPPVASPGLPGWLKTGLAALAGAGAALGGNYALGKLKPSTAAPMELELQYWTDQDGKVHIGPPAQGQLIQPQQKAAP